MNIIDVFGRLSETAENQTIAAGRYAFQADDEGNIVPDVVAKLRLGGTETLLEIGCGTGNLLMPLSRHVGSATGVDHPACLARMEGALPPNLTLVPGSWPGAAVGGPFSRILVYSVLHYLDDADAADAFIDASLKVLAPGGWLLVGDLPNRDAIARFGATEFGRQFIETWRRRVAEISDQERARDVLFAQAALPAFIDDGFVLSTIERLRLRGMEAYVVPQRPELPFGHTREDIVVHIRPR